MQRTVDSIYKNVLLHFDAYFSAEQFCAGSIHAKGVIAINTAKYILCKIFNSGYQSEQRFTASKLWNWTSQKLKFL